MWLAGTAIAGELDREALTELSGLKPGVFQRGTVLFRPGDEPRGFLIVLSGRVGVYLTGPNGREIQLYTVSPGETCIQTTIGLVGEQAYTGEAVALSDMSAVLVPQAAFQRLMDASPAFRRFVFHSLGNRLGDVTRMLEQVAFVSIGRRLAQALVDNADAQGQVALTHQELAVRIGSAREVVSRRLESLRNDGVVALERGHIAIADRARLIELARE
jgi:CRP/FNR family transcriptional regulator